VLKHHQQAIGTPECLDPFSRELELLSVRVDHFQIGAKPTDGLGLYLRHLEEPLQNELARLISGLWVRNIRNPYHTKRQPTNNPPHHTAASPPTALLVAEVPKRPSAQTNTERSSAKMSALSLPPNLPPNYGSGWQTRNLIRGVKAGRRGVGGMLPPVSAASPLAPSHSAVTDSQLLR